MQGIGVSPGIAIGRAYLLRRQKERVTGHLLADEAAVEREMSLYRGAVSAAMDELEALTARAGKAEAEILAVQEELLQDPSWDEEVIRRIEAEKNPARDAVLLATEQFVQVFQGMEDPYFQARAADVQDVGNRVVRLLGGGVTAEMPPGEGWIVVAEDLSPSDTMALDTSRVCGFVTEAGGKTSHAAIVARLRGLPAVVGTGAALASVEEGDEILLDGATGVVLVNPSQEVKDEYWKKREVFLARQQLLRGLKDREAVTPEGVRIHLQANIAAVEDMDQALEQGAEGVGLFRTELLFMERDRFPTEEEQFHFYKQVLLRSGGWPVTIRTLDIGGDKSLPYFGLPKEENPFLGYRAIRICLDRKDLFLTQLRAILRASVFGKCRIMFPMIGRVEELREAKAVVARAREELTVEGTAFAAEVPVGIMIEIPSAALTADLLAKEADFFSIGTNDLCQYTLAVDRMNEKIAALYDPFHPAVLRLIKMVIEEGLRQGIPVGMCGELAGDLRATELLLEMGLREFSMSATSIPEIKNAIIHMGKTANENRP